jgi:ribosomal subunit interface protein
MRQENAAMQVPLEIRFHNLDPSPAIESSVRERAKKLERFADRLVSCRVTINAPHKHHRQGNLYHVTVEARLPGSEVVASREPPQRHSHEDVYVALRDAFNAARRQLQDRIRVQRGKIKAHEVPAHGKIVALHSDRDFGNIATPDGREIYFHRNSVLNADFDRLEAGMEVRYREVAGELGPQASSVQVMGKHHLIG